MIGKKIQDVSSLQTTRAFQQLSSTGQPHWLRQGLWGTRSPSPALNGINSDRGNHCSMGMATAKPLCLAGQEQPGASCPLHSPPDLFPAFQQSTAELGRTAVLAVLEENNCPVLAALSSRASSGQLSISYRKNKRERRQKCPQAKQSSKRGKDKKVRSFQLGHHPFSISLPPLTPSSDPLCA